MADEYTPTTATVRTRYQVGALNYIGCGAEFDRWLAARDAGTRRQALEEAAVYIESCYLPDEFNDAHIVRALAEKKAN